MLQLNIPGTGEIKIKYLVCDFSGTLSVDGVLVDGVEERLNQLAETLEIYVITADTHGKAQDSLMGVSCKLHMLEGSDHDIQKQQFVENLGSESVVAIGNGNNDRLMLNAAQISIAVCLAEGVAIEAARFADILSYSITDTLDLLLKPNRLIATLRL